VQVTGRYDDERPVAEVRQEWTEQECVEPAGRDLTAADSELADPWRPGRVRQPGQREAQRSRLGDRLVVPAEVVHRDAAVHDGDGVQVAAVANEFDQDPVTELVGQRPGVEGVARPGGVQRAARMPGSGPDRRLQPQLLLAQLGSRPPCE
jgi:hypothetical protein